MGEHRQSTLLVLTYFLLITLQILRDIFLKRSRLSAVLKDLSLEYNLLRRIQGLTPPENKYTPNYFHQSMAMAAFQVVHTNDTWHTLLVEHFRPPTVEGSWNLGPPSNAILCPELPSIRYRTSMYDNGKACQNPNIYTYIDYPWIWIQEKTRRLEDVQEKVVRDIISLLDDSEDTRLWRTEQGKESFVKWLSYLFSERSTVVHASEAMLLTEQRTERLISPHY